MPTEPQGSRRLLVAKSIRENPTDLQIVFPASPANLEIIDLRLAEPRLYNGARLKYKGPIMAEPLEPGSPVDRGGREAAVDGPPEGKPRTAPVAAGEHPGGMPVGSPPAADGARDVAPVSIEEPKPATVLASPPWPRLARPGDALERVSPVAERRLPSRSFSWLSWVAAQICGFGLLLGGYFLGQTWPTGPKAGNNVGPTHQDAPASKAQRAGSERALATADRALAAERVRDYQGAHEIYEGAIQRQLPLPAAEYRLALLSLQQADYPQAQAHLSRSIMAGDEVADCELMRASLAGMKGNYADAATFLAAAARAQPFNAKFCFCWGEALRRAGRLTDAVERLTQALARPDSPAARELYRFKMRLAKVEAGDDPLDNELSGHIHESSPEGGWLLLAAAREMHRGNDSEAAVLLTKAKAALPPEVFSVYVQDYLFQARADRPELRALLGVPVPADAAPDGAPLPDPAAWTAAEADPAVWPPFTKAP